MAKSKLTSIETDMPYYKWNKNERIISVLVTIASLDRDKSISIGDGSFVATTARDISHLRNVLRHAAYDVDFPLLLKSVSDSRDNPSHAFEAYLSNLSGLRSQPGFGKKTSDLLFRVIYFSVNSCRTAFSVQLVDLT